MAAQPYAILTADHDCDGTAYALYSPAAFAEQSYFSESEGSPIDRATFERDYAPTLSAWELDYWRKEGYVSLSRRR